MHILSKVLTHVYLLQPLRQEANSSIFPRNKKNKVAMKAKNKAQSSSTRDFNPNIFRVCSCMKTATFKMKSLWKYANTIQIKRQDSITDNNSCNILTFSGFQKYDFLKASLLCRVQSTTLYIDKINYGAQMSVEEHTSSSLTNLRPPTLGTAEHLSISLLLCP